MAVGAAMAVSVALQGIAPASPSFGAGLLGQKAVNINMEDTGEGPRTCFNPLHRQYCEERCTLLNYYLNMGLDMPYVHMKVLLDEYTSTRLWLQCPSDWFSLKLRVLHRQILDHGQVDLAGAETSLKHLFSGGSLNLTEYFHPRRRGSAVFLSLHRFVSQASASYNMVFVPNPLDTTPLSLLRRAIASNDMLPSSILDVHVARTLDVADACSLGALALRLASVARLHRAVTAAMYGGFAAPSKDVKGSARVNAIFNEVEHCLASFASEYTLATRILEEGMPIFGVLDLLDCRTPVILDNEVSSRDDSIPRPSPYGFIMHVLPIRDFESNFVRTYARCHCDEGYKTVLVSRHEMAAATGRGFAVAEIGAYLGGCTFWPLFHLPGTRAMAVEPFAPAVRAMSQTATVNGFGADRFQVVETCISDEHTPLASAMFNDGMVLQPGMTVLARAESVFPEGMEATLGPQQVPRACVTLSDLLAVPDALARRWDVLRVHTSGLELPVLRSGESAFRRGHVATLVTMLTAAHTREVLTEIVDLLLGVGARLTYVGELIDSPARLLQLHVEPTIAIPLVADFVGANLGGGST